MMLDGLRDGNRTLKDIVDLYYSRQGLAMKAKRLLKTVNWYLPFDLMRLLKRFV